MVNNKLSYQMGIIVSTTTPYHNTTTKSLRQQRGNLGGDGMKVGFISTNVISAYHH